MFGFPVSGTNAGVSFIAVQQGGPELWTGGAWGPEAGLLGILAVCVGAALILGWVRVTRGEINLQERLAVYRPNPARVSKALHDKLPATVKTPAGSRVGSRSTISH